MSLTRSLRLLFSRILLPLFASLVPLGCCIVDEQAHYYYPTALGSEAQQLFAWPASSEDQFRFLAQENFEALGDSSAIPETLQPSRDRDRIEALAVHAGSFTVLLPLECERSVREAALKLIEQLSRALPQLSTHCVAIRSDLHSIDTGAELHRLLMREGSYHEESRPVGFMGGIAGAMGKAWAMAELPNFVVVPLNSGSGRFAVYGDLRTQGEGATVVECEAAELPWLLAARLTKPEARTLTGTWGTPDSGNYSKITFADFGSTFVALYLPHDLPSARRAQAEELMTHVCTEPFAPIVIAQADTTWDWSECTSGDSVRKHVPFDLDRSFIVGPVRQSVMLPKPEKPVPKPAE